MKKFKKLIAVFLSGLILVSSCCVFVSAEEWALEKALEVYESDCAITASIKNVGMEYKDSYQIEKIHITFQESEQAYEYLSVGHIVEFTGWDVYVDSDGWRCYAFEGYDADKNWWSFDVTSDNNGFVLYFNYYVEYESGYRYSSDGIVIYPENAMLFTADNLCTSYGTSACVSVVSPYRFEPEYRVELISDGGAARVSSEEKDVFTVEGLRDGGAYLNLIDSNGEVADTCRVEVEFTVWNWICYILFLGFIWM